MKYELQVGNIGRVDQCDNKQRMLKEFGEWVAISRSGYGRGAGEEVVLYEDGEPIREYIPKQS